MHLPNSPGLLRQQAASDRPGMGGPVPLQRTDSAGRTPPAAAADEDSRSRQSQASRAAAVLPGLRTGRIHRCDGQTLQRFKFLFAVGYLYLFHQPLM